jgi:Carboxypeptidase regulatory-like domain/TonB-dependent Receptor Plug Domain/TonB dependent receptor
MTDGGAFMKKVVGVGVFLAFVFCLFASIPARAQVTGATLNGTVTDASGAVISNAQVAIKNTATGSTKDVTTDSAGFYTAPNLPAGPYEVKVSAAGFNTAVSTVTLAVGAQQSLNIPMKVGETSQTVQVTEAAPQIDLTSSTLTGQVESQTVEDLPLNGRDWTSLATLHPGVALIEEQMDYSTSARGNRGFGSELTISGQRTTTNNYRLDGISVNDYANSGPGNVIGAALGVDAIQEFSVLTGGFSAEYGKAAGGVVNAITKSGSNSFHGDLYEFLRNSAFDSRDYFSRTSNTPLADFKRNQFGASAGGPIIKDKTFIFGDYEGMRQVKGITTNVKVPSIDARNGKIFDTDPTSLTFGDILDSNGKGIPNNTGNTPYAGPPCVPGKTTLRDPNAGFCVDDMAFNAWQMFPAPTPGTTSVNTANFINSGVQRVPENFYTFRVDHKLSANDSLGGTYLFDNTYFDQPDAFNNDVLHSQTRRQTVVLQESHTFSANVLNAARVGYSRTHVINVNPTTAVNPAATDKTLGTVGVPGSPTPQNAPEIQITGFTRMPGGVGTGSYYIHTFNNYQFYDDAFWTHGNHTLKFGGGVERMQYNYEAFQNQGGLWKFKSLVKFDTNQATHFEEGIPSTITPRELRQSLFAGYVQDDWRFRPNLTLNIGVRYEMTTVINDAQGKITSLPTISDSSPQCGKSFTSPFLGNLSGGSCGSVGPYYSNPTTHNFEPRIGFAWDPFRDGKTSVRGGFGIYDVLPLPGYFLLQENQSGPFMIFSSLDTPLLAGAFPQQGEPLLTNPPAGVKPGKLATSTIESHPHRNYVLEWNLNVQRQLTPSMSLTVGYVGSHGVHNLTRGDDGNMTQGVQTPSGLLFPCGAPIVFGSCTPGNDALGNSAQINPTNGIIRYIYWSTDSVYDALNLSLDKKMSHGLQFQVSYTFGKSLDESSSTIAGDTFEQGLNSLYYFAPKSLRGPSDFNVAHTLAINTLYALPTPQWNGIAKAALGGWQMGGIVKFNSGVPTTPIIGGDPAGLGNGGADQFGIPDLIPGCKTTSPGSLSYINTNCYTTPMATPAIAANCSPFGLRAAGTNGPTDPGSPGIAGSCANLLGNAGRNSITGPHLVNVDFSMVKNTAIKRISETFNVQFRAEIFNIFNHTNFLPPEPVNNNAGAQVLNTDGSVVLPKDGGGSVDSLATQPRDVQFAIKVIW